MKIFNPSQVKRSYCYGDQRIYRASHLVLNISGHENECETQKRTLHKYRALGI